MKLFVFAILAVLSTCFALKVPLIVYGDSTVPVAHVSVGRPAQVLPLSINMMSKDSYIVSERCITCPSHVKFNTTSSVTYKGQLGQKETLSCGQSRSIQSELARDYIGFDAPHRVHSFSFDAVTKDNNCGQLESGVSGTLSVVPTPYVDGNIFYQMYTQGVIKKPYMQFVVNSESSLTMKFDSDVDVSGISHWQKIVGYEYWGLEGQSFSFGSYKSKLSGVVFDLFPKAFAAPHDTYEALLKAVNAKYSEGRYTVDCASIDSFPVVSFNFKYGSLTMSGQQYIRKWGDVCIPDFVSGGDDLWIIGTSIFEENDIVFNMSDLTIGFK
eukprot:TRINITY_DN67065_c0_g1_i1.p1 TRINITY_DN67065_c0_g1~~TRINITY_DN67065_c0_g1_i1.p1  ORF type:complete len:326 (-),score=76.13 TRINITY_DN67065_c0_g1_i1:699-1676(-)